MSNDRLLELMSRKLAGEATAEELEEIKSLLSADTETSESCQLLQRYWDQQQNVNPFFVEAAFEKIAHRLDSPVAVPVVEIHRKEKRLNSKRLQLTAAAAAIVLVGGLIFLLNAGDKTNRLTAQETELIQEQNPKGMKRSFVLADGSKIWLNADSKIQFPRKFNSSTRDVFLNGEAFFDVAKDPSKPFIIHLTNGTIRVLGTSFNVRAYDNEKMVETSVATGKVAFIPNFLKSGKKQDTVFLSPNDKVRYLLMKEEVIVEPTVSKEDTAWIAGKLVFKGMTFEEIGMQLERNFDKKIVFLSDDARQFRLTGSFQNNSLEEILFYLSKSKDFEYKITNVEVLINIEAN